MSVLAVRAKVRFACQTKERPNSKDNKGRQIEGESLSNFSLDGSFVVSTAHAPNDWNVYKLNIKETKKRCVRNREEEREMETNEVTNMRKVANTMKGWSVRVRGECKLGQTNTGSVGPVERDGAMWRRNICSIAALGIVRHSECCVCVTAMDINKVSQCNTFVQYVPLPLAWLMTHWHWYTLRRGSGDDPLLLSAPHPRECDVFGQINTRNVNFCNFMLF